MACRFCLSERMHFEGWFLMDRYRIFLRDFPLFLVAHLQLEVLFGNSSSPLYDRRVLSGNDENGMQNIGFWKLEKIGRFREKESESRWNAGMETERKRNRERKVKTDCKKGSMIVVWKRDDFWREWSGGIIGMGMVYGFSCILRSNGRLQINK